MNKVVRTFTEILMMAGAAIGFIVSVEEKEVDAAITFAFFFLFLAAMLLFRFWQPRIKPLSRETRTAIVAVGMWVVALQAWGYIWEWDRHFDGGQFFALHLAVPLIAWLAWRGLRWASR